MLVDFQVKKRVLRRITYGVYIVTAHLDEFWSGGTVSWLSQCSFDPPLVMMGLRRDSSLYAVVRQTGRAAVNLLGADQKALAADFLHPLVVAGDRLNGHPFHMTLHGLPVLDEAPWHFVAEARDWVERGDHSVMVAEVVDCGGGRDVGRPLVIWDAGWTYGG